MAGFEIVRTVGTEEEASLIAGFLAAGGVEATVESKMSDRVCRSGRYGPVTAARMPLPCRSRQPARAEALPEPEPERVPREGRAIRQFYAAAMSVERDVKLN